MIPLASVVFFGSLACIAALFALKVFELETGKVPIPRIKKAADLEARRVKELLFAAKLDLTKMPSLVVYGAHVALHFAALEFAHAARGASRRAHQIADLVSHKGNFQRRQTRSEFLRMMSGKRRDSSHGQSQEKQVEF